MFTTERFIITERSTGQVLRVTHDQGVMRRYASNSVYHVVVA